MAPVLKRLTMASAGSTSSSGTGGPAGFSSMSPRRVARRFSCLLMSALYSPNSLKSFVRQACCSLWIDSGLKRWCSPSWRHLYLPPGSRSRSRRVGRSESRPVPGGRLARDDVDADAGQARRRPGEVLVDDVLVEADRLEDLRAAVALDGGDPHLGDDLHHALVEGLDVVLDRVLLVHAGEHALGRRGRAGSRRRGTGSPRPRRSR